jgi:fatty-acyl-CoA synthase
MGAKINFGRMLLQIARQYADKEAVVNIERDRRLSFMDLHLLTNKIANMLKDKFGLTRGDVYVNLLENDNICLTHLWMFKSDVAGAWLNYRDSFDEHKWQIEFIKPRLIFIETALLKKYYENLRSLNITIICMDPPDTDLEGVYYFWDLIEKSSDREPGISHDADNDVVLYRFTGGTTGKGKCAMYSLNNIISPAYGFYAHTEEMIPHHIRFLHITPLSHASSLFVTPILFKGGTTVTMNQPDLMKFCQYIQDEKITSTILVPTILYRFLELDVTKKYDLTSLETVFYGASPMSPDKLKQLQEKFGNIFVQAYGATEAYPPVALLGKAEHQLKTEEDAARLNAAGKPVPCYEIKIVDDDGKEVPTGETGEAWLRGPGIIKGYFGNPEQTAKEFHPDGWWKSGDIMYQDEKGYVYIVDRKKDMIITGGFNVYAAEVEEALNAHPAVLMSAVVGIPHEDWGEIIHAEVVLKNDAEVSVDELITFCKENKGSYKAPKSITFVKELPTSIAGKILRRKVREKYWKNQDRAVH